MKEFRIKREDAKGPSVYGHLCDDGWCPRPKAKNSNYCTSHARDGTVYRVQSKIFGFWRNISRTRHGGIKAAETEMIAAADGANPSIVSTWRLRDDGILEQTS